MATAVEVRRLSKRFGATEAVRDVSFNVEEGEIFGLLGPNGAGKTTTIRMVLDIFRPDAGTVRLFGGPLDAHLRQRIGYLPEERGLYQDQRLEDVLIYLATLKGCTERDARSRLQDWFERFELGAWRGKKVRELSRGMQQKAQLIATLLHEPALIIIDEPFSGLDPVNTRLVKEVLEEQRRSGRAVLMSTHQMHQVEALCNRIVLIDDGKAVLYGPVGEIKRDFAGNVLRVEGQGEFGDLPGVLEARSQGDGWELTLVRGSDPQALLRALVSRPGIRLERFEIGAPSLDDIFVQVVRQGLPDAVGRAAVRFSEADRA